VVVDVVSLSFSFFLTAEFVGIEINGFCSANQSINQSNTTLT
jgi:hypothetical protein